MACKKSFLKIRFWKTIIKKVLKKLTLFFLLNLVQFNGQNYQRQKWTGIRPVALQFMKQVHKNSFISCISDQVWWCNINWFLNYSKNYIC